MEGRMYTVHLQTLIKLLKDRSLSLTETINGSGVLQDIDTDDVTPLVHAASVLRDTDQRILDDIQDSLDSL